MVSICKVHQRAWTHLNRLAEHCKGHSGRFLSADWYSGYSLCPSLRSSIRQDRVQTIGGPWWQACDLVPGQCTRCSELFVAWILISVPFLILFSLCGTLTLISQGCPAQLILQEASQNIFQSEPICINSLIFNCHVLVMCHCLFCGFIACCKHTTLYCLFHQAVSPSSASQDLAQSLEIMSLTV